MTQADEGSGRATTTRVVHIKNSYGSGKGQFIRLAAIENGCVKWLIFGLPKPANPAGGGGGGGIKRPIGIRSPFTATVWLVCGTAAVEQILSGATQDAYNEIINSLREALLMRSSTPAEIMNQQNAINKIFEGPKLKLEYKSTGEAVEWWKKNFGFLYEQSVWTDIWSNTYGP